MDTQAITGHLPLNLNGIKKKGRKTPHRRLPTSKREWEELKQRQREHDRRVSKHLAQL